MELLTLPPGVDTLLIPLDQAVRAEPGTRRVIYFEASREGWWTGRARTLRQMPSGPLGSSSFPRGTSTSITGPGSGTPGHRDAPRVRDRASLEVRRAGPSVFVKAELFSNLAPPPPGSSGEWADRVWHSLTQMQPPMRWFPSVFGKLAPDAVVEVEVRDGQKVRVIRGPIEWYSVGLAQRAQNPALPPVSLEPLGAFAKAEATGRPVTLGRIAVVPYRVLAKALTQAAVLTAGDPTPWIRSRGLRGCPPSGGSLSKASTGAWPRGFCGSSSWDG
ncbi:hypothetical protein [Thermus antranikianii]|uniref:hypothetical protein n=1 Tax=Thermus antranikianii TaxID=88190 RepID=UPI001C73E5CE|nr:hypothetical protein [Thermus antranikianii]QWK23112.1 MAG: hypothetical protein KNN15_06705 [Thermus antranikianii]